MRRIRDPTNEIDVRTNLLDTINRIKSCLKRTDPSSVTAARDLDELEIELSMLQHDARRSPKRAVEAFFSRYDVRDVHAGKR